MLPGRHFRTPSGVNETEGTWHSSVSAIQRAAASLQKLIRARFPTANFTVARGEDPEGTYVYVIVDTDDLTTVLEPVADQLFTFQVEQELPIYVGPRRPLLRTVWDNKPLVERRLDESAMSRP